MKHVIGSNERDSFIWNSIGGILNAAQSVFILMVITRTAGIDAAGIFSIAYATGNLFMNLGNYGVRNYQISDLNEQYSFRDYLTHRVFTMFLMLLASVIYCVYSYSSGNYSLQKTAIVFAMCVLKSLDCLEDVFEGRMQQRDRLDLSGKLVTIRILIAIGGMIVTLILTNDLFVSVIVAIVLEAVTIAVVVMYDRAVIAYSKTFHGFRALGKLMVVCFPVCLVNFLSFYLTNAPKYAIDGVMSEEAQAKYNFIAMPVFVIQMLNMFIYQPILVKMTIALKEKRKKDFLRSFRNVTAGLLVLSAIVLAGSWLLGIPVLSLLYATDLSGLKTEFMIIMVGSVFLAMNGFYNALLTIMREQNKIPVVYVIGSVLSLLVTSRMVELDGIRGAVIAYTVIMILITILLTAVFIYSIHRRFPSQNSAEK
ncbi:MAG: lipopolysaccharide biosynthesis protein [Eubacteriales bacterium]|jgi:O-antigen/teichoic acid export membrane protein